MKLSTVIWHNSIHDWIIAALVALGIFLVAVVAKRWTMRLLAPKKASHISGVRSMVWRLIGRVSVWLLLAIAMTVGSLLVYLHPALRHAIHTFLQLAVFFQVGLLAQLAITLTMERLSGQAHDRVSGTALTGFSVLGKVVLWVVLFLVALENIGVHITALITGLGIGGIAVGLAMQGVVTDLISSLAIVLDRPFAQGDYVSLSTVSGTVERIGLKTTRIRALSGEQVVVPNATLISNMIQNFQTLHERRVVLDIGVVYGTPADKLEQIPQMIQAIIDATPELRFDRAHFSGLGASALTFQIVYYVTSGDYTVHMDRQQTVLLALVRKFEFEDIEFAFPTQTLYIESTSNASANGTQSVDIGGTSEP